MDSDSEMPVASDEEMVDDEDYYYYSDEGEGDDGDASGGGGASGDEDVSAGDYEGREAEGSDEAVSTREQRYIVLTEKDISERQEEDISEVSALLLIPREEASVLLHHYKWDISKVNDEWFSDEDKVRGIVGLLMNGTDIHNSRKLTCGICFEGYSSDMMSSAGCAHFYCHECWEGLSLCVCVCVCVCLNVWSNYCLFLCF